MKAYVIQGTAGAIESVFVTNEPLPKEQFQKLGKQLLDVGYTMYGFDTDNIRELESHVASIVEEENEV